MINELRAAERFAETATRVEEKRCRRDVQWGGWLVLDDLEGSSGLNQRIFTYIFSPYIWMYVGYFVVFTHVVPIFWHLKRSFRLVNFCKGVGEGWFVVFVSLNTARELSAVRSTQHT